MQASDVEIGAVYLMKMTDKETQVRIEREHEDGGWVGTNLNTNRSVRVKSAGELRSKVKRPGNEPGTVETAKATEKETSAEGTEKPRRRAKKKLTKKDRQALQAQSKADQENARLRDQREESSDGMTASERAMAESEPAQSASESMRSAKPKKIGCLDAAVQVLQDADEPMTCTQIMEQILQRELWSTNGRTPAATLYSAILREIQRKGGDARFVLAERGKFKLNQ